MFRNYKAILRRRNPHAEFTYSYRIIEDVALADDAAVRWFSRRPLPGNGGGFWELVYLFTGKRCVFNG